MKMRLLNRATLPMVAVLIFVNGCSSSSEIGEKQAIAVAKQEATRRGWEEVETGSSRFENDRWVIMLERLPKVVGGHAFVEVSTNGKPIRFIPGK